MKIGVVGCGVIGSAVAERMAGAEHTLFAFDKSGQAAEKLSSFATVCPTIQSLCREAELIFLTVKPQNLAELSPLLAPHLNSRQTLLSSLAGVSLEVLKHHFKAPKVARMMPNLAIKLGRGVVGICGEFEGEELLAPLGTVIPIPESQFDAFTALAGSGPAFALAIIEGMVEGGVQMGLPADLALAVTEQMWEGTLALLQETPDHPAKLKWQVCSPAGTTIAGLAELERGAVRASLSAALMAALTRAKELGGGE